VSACRDTDSKKEMKEENVDSMHENESGIESNNGIALD